MTTQEACKLKCRRTICGDEVRINGTNESYEVLDVKFYPDAKVIVRIPAFADIPENWEEFPLDDVSLVQEE